MTGLNVVWSNWEANKIGEAANTHMHVCREVQNQSEGLHVDCNYVGRLLAVAPDGTVVPGIGR